MNSLPIDLPQNGDYTILFYTQKNADAIQIHYVDYAKYYDMIDNSYPWTPEYVAKMKALNPNLKVIHYRSVKKMYGGSNIEYFRQKGWILKDKSGNELQESARWGGVVMDIGNPEVAHYMGQRIASDLAQGYDGTFGDNGQPYLNWDKSSAGIPINPRTGEEYVGSTWPHTSDVFVDDFVKYLKVLKSYMGDKLLITNTGLKGGGSAGYFAMKSYMNQIFDVVDGNLMEFFLSDSGSSPSGDWHSESEWMKDIEYFVELGKRKKHIKVPTDRNVKSRENAYYVFASFLMGVTDFKYTYLWSHSIEPATQDWAREIVDVEVGSPIGAYYKNTDGLYVREFSRVTVYVNPSSQVRGGMQPHTGKLVYKSGGG